MILNPVKRPFLGLLILLCISGNVFASQTNVSGVINEYGRVTGLGSDYVLVGDPLQYSKFGVGDTVLLIQMKGAQADVTNAFQYGNLQAFEGSPGKYEFLIVLSKTGPDKITFRNNIINAFDIVGDLQIVKAASYNSVVVDADLTCAPWSNVTKTGGVLTMIVGKTVKLDANIDVTGRGFLGGGISTSLAECANSNPLLLNKFSYDQSSDSAGLKGESVVTKGWIDFGTQVPIFPSYEKGKGANFTGGGGGNGYYSGGGGGANYGVGGKGGKEKGFCLPTFIPVDGGVGGKPVKFTGLEGGIFMGGGGGSSTYTGAPTATPGGNGGGIIIIICDSIIGNGKIIKADGAAASAASGNAGAGGGGGGGSIALYLGGFSTSLLTISASGGKGGDNLTNTFGEGGGGGGGFVWINNIPVPGNVTRPVTGGAVGLRSGPSTGGAGAPGEGGLTDFIALLNGFLFNSIRSSITGDQIDSICSNMLPRKIYGTKPVGGTLPYTFLWEKSYDQITWFPLTNDADPVNYTPTVIETATVFYRRTITDSSLPTALVDVSKPVKVIVQPFIKNNIIGTSDTICRTQNPPPFTSLAALADGNGKYSFNWGVSLDASSYTVPLNAHISEGYTPPPALLVTSWYRRTVTSGRCIDSTAIVKITVLPKINSASNLIISPPEEICHGMLFTNLVATIPPALSGGDDTYRYKWVSSVTSPVSGYALAQGTITNPGYNPVEASATFPGKEYFRRIVYSGSNDVCSDTSAAVLLTDWPVITNNTITATQTICYGTNPAKLLGSLPLNGNGSYTYTWQDSTKGHTWQNIPGAVNQVSPDYQPPVLTDTTRYRRIVNSSACSDISKSVIINVHKPIANNNVSLLSVNWDTTICSGAIPKRLFGSTPTGGTAIPGDYAYSWESSASKLAGYSAIGGANGKDYQPLALNSTTYFRRFVISGTCSAYSDSVITIRVLPVITNNTIPSDFAVCYNIVPPLITGSAPAGGAGPGTYLYTWRESPDGVTWSNASGTFNGKDYQPPALTLPRKYKRIVKSGSLNCCIDSTGIISVSINPLPTGTITTTTDTTVCGGSPVPVKLHLTGASKWKVIYTENGVQNTINKIQAADTTLLITKTQAAAMATYNYGLFQVQDVNGCVATSLTGTRKIDVYKVPASNPGIDDAICGPVYTLKAVPSVGTGLWTWSKTTTATGPGDAIFSPNNTLATATVSVDSLTAAWGAENKYKFIWTETNWVCTDKDSITITFNQRTTPVDPGVPKDLYSLNKIDTLMSLNPPVGTGTWSVISGGATITNDSIVSGLSVGLNKFEWKITNGACESKGEYIINVFELKIPEGFSPNSDNINDEFVIQGLDIINDEATLRILNSAGTEVFFTTNANDNIWTSWKGENGNGILPEGTYYYLLIIKSKRNSNIFSKSGFIILKRFNSN